MLPPTDHSTEQEESGPAQTLPLDLVHTAVDQRVYCQMIQKNGGADDGLHPQSDMARVILASPHSTCNNMTGMIATAILQIPTRQIAFPLGQGSHHAVAQTHPCKLGLATVLVEDLGRIRGT